MIRAYRPEDYGEVARWYAAHGQAPKAPQNLPRAGLIVPGVAAGWLYLTDSAVALLENYITNPHAGAAERNEALDLITGTLVAKAKDAGRSTVVALTADASIADRASRHGMREIGTYRVLGMEV